MDDRRFDALAKSLARGTNRRTLLKGLLGLGGAVAAGGSLLENDAQAARRPIPTPRPPTCPGQQVPCGSGCCCPLGQERCGPDCCTEDNVPAPETGHSECCDNACCFGTCYGEEFCCPTNNRSGGEFPVPPTHKICNTANGTECCEFDQECCGVDGCCDTVCTEDGHCCAPADVCSGGGESPDLCCVNDLTTSSVCCGGGTNDNACFEAVAGVCCTDSDCIHPCDVCNLETHLCVSSCDNDTQVCCSYPDGTDQCVTGECCIGGEPGCEDSICCLREGRNICTFGVTCGCGCENEADCCFINDVFVGCVDLTQEGACCTDADCGDPCLSCNLETRTCGPSCDTETQICCTEQAGPGVCVTGVCCPAARDAMRVRTAALGPRAWDRTAPRRRANAIGCVPTPGSTVAPSTANLPGATTKAPRGPAARRGNASISMSSTIAWLAPARTSRASNSRAVPPASTAAAVRAAILSANNPLRAVRILIVEGTSSAALWTAARGDKAALQNQTAPHVVHDQRSTTKAGARIACPRRSARAVGGLAQSR